MGARPARLNITTTHNDRAEEPHGLFGAVVSAAGADKVVALAPGGPYLATTLADARSVLLGQDTFAMPFDVSRERVRGSRRRTVRADKETPALTSDAVDRGRAIFATEFARTACRLTSPRRVETVDALDFLRDPTARSTTAAMVPSVSAEARNQIAELTLRWIDSLAPIISARRSPRRWSRVRRAERAARRDLGSALSASGCSDPAATASALAAGVQVPIAAGAWVLTLIGSRPDVQGQLRADPAMPLATVWEVLRLYPPTWVLPRISTRDVTIGSEFVPRFRPVLVSPVALGRLSQLVPGPAENAASLNEFEPARWLDASKRPGAWLPFGAGAHACPGRSLGIAQLLHVTSWTTTVSISALEPAVDESRGLLPRPSTVQVSPLSSEGADS